MPLMVLIRLFHRISAIPPPWSLKIADIGAGQLRSGPHASLPRTLTACLVAITAIGTMVLAPPQARAAEPQTSRCQTGFLQASPPTSADHCSSPTAGTSAVAVPTGFQESVAWSGLTNPTAIRFAADG